MRANGLLIAIALCLALIASPPRCLAQSPSDDQRLSEMERQIRELRQLIEQMQQPVAPASAGDEAQARSAPERLEDALQRIRDEGFNRSQVMQTLSYLTDVIGPRLTGSPNLKRANEWTRDQLTAWGLSNAHLDPWGPFGRGWSLKRFSMQITEPQTILLSGYPKAWSAGLDKPIEAEVLHIDLKSEADFAQHKGKLKGAVVLVGAPREVPARFEPLATRVPESALLQLSNSEGANVSPAGVARTMSGDERRALFTQTTAGRAVAAGATTRPTTTAATRPTTNPARPPSAGQIIAFLTSEGAAAIISPSSRGDGGSFVVQASTVPETRWRSAATAPSTQPASTRPWSVDAPHSPPQLILAIEDYNRLVRMLQQGEKLRIAMDLQVQFHDQAPMEYNTIAEIPGTDLAHEVVMLGAHLDSWHSGTGTTDNGSGVAAVMEAMRIIKALDLHPRRTIRVGLWTGEEQGLLGSKGYVAKHLGQVEESVSPATQPTTRRARSTTRPARKLVKQPAYDHFSAYFNLDHGTGKIRGIYMQGNEQIRPVFRSWLIPFVEHGAQTLSLARTGNTDHVPFDAIGLPAFQFIQDPVEYWTRTHHSNQDVFDRAQGDDLKQAATILATFAYQAAMSDEKLPRRPLDNIAPAPSTPREDPR